MRISFSGQAGSGKDFAAKYLKFRHGGAILKFAEPLKKIAGHIQSELGLPREKDRQLLQLLGTDWGRNKDKDLWVNKFGDYYDLYLLNHNTNLYVTDTRFPNEAEYLRERGFITVSILRDDLEHDDDWRNHESETALNDYKFDYYICNYGNNEFFNRLDDLVETIKCLKS
jgi:hypothetical protein